MAKITRYDGNFKAFGSDATGTERTVFGSTTQTDDLTTNLGAEYQRGWGVLPSGQKPPKQYFNGALFGTSQAVAYLHQAGIAEWNGEQEYHAGSITNRNGQIFVCLKNNHVSASAPETDSTNWRLDDGSVATISALLNRTTVGTVNVLNYHAGLEGGGGVFYWDASKPKTEHNGGTVIDPAKVFPTNWNNQTQLTTWFTAGSSGTGCWIRQYDGAVNVKWFGAKGDCVTDDTQALQKALDTQNVFVDAGIYTITGTLVLQDYSTVTGVHKHIFMDFGTDYNIEIPSWGLTASTVQYKRGLHGAILSGGGRSTIKNIVFRCPAAATAEDTLYPLDNVSSHLTIDSCTFHMLSTVAKDNISAWGAWTFNNNQITAVANVFYGTAVDMKVTNNTFTSCNGTPVFLTFGAGYNKFISNRFEWNSSHIFVGEGARQNIFANNTFDSSDHFGIKIQDNSSSTIIANNIFWRNGRLAQGTLDSCHIRIRHSNTIITGNTFNKGVGDNGELPVRPDYCVVFEGGDFTDTPVVFNSNDVRNSCNVSLFKRAYGTEVNAIVSDGFDLPDIDENLANTLNDTFAGELSNVINPLLRNETFVNIYQSRAVNGYYGSANKINLIGVGSNISVNSTNSSFGVSSIHNILWGNKSYFTINGTQYSNGVPREYKEDSNWRVGKIVYNSAPTSGGVIGWIKVSSGDPDVWKSIGTIAV